MLNRRANQTHLQTANPMNIKNMRQTSSPIISATTSTMNEDFDLDFIHVSMAPPNQHYLTIEDLKSTRNSCWLCGCNWLEDHVSLDCQECGGYALSRPCPNCDGKCKQIWHRNLSSTHDFHRAFWIGQCGLLRNSNGNCNQNGEQKTGIISNGRHVTDVDDDDDECDVGLMLLADDSIAKDLVSQLQSTAVASTNTTGSQNSPMKASASSCCSSQPSSASSSDSESESFDSLNRHDNHHLHRPNTTNSPQHHHHHNHNHRDGQHHHNARPHHIHHLHHSHHLHRGRQHS